MDILKHRDYYGSIEYSEEDGCLYGKVLGLKYGLILYEGNTPKELIADFKEAVDFYLESCKDRGVDPEKSQYENFTNFIPSTTV